MKIRKWSYPIAVVGVLLLTIVQPNALTLTKDTVYESKFSEADPMRATWNDSVSLLNKTKETVTIDAIYFSTPPGKYADIMMGYGDAYRRDGVVDGPVIYSGQSYSPSWDPGKTILPGGRVTITGFMIERCIACPVGQGGIGGTEMDTLSMYLIFDTKVSKDTLVVIGDIRRTTTGMIRGPVGQHPEAGGGAGTPFHRLYNILGRFLPLTERLSP